MIGETLGSYRILSRLGAGGMGEVFLAQHTRIDRQAAIKMLLPELSSNKEMVDRFFAEALATSSIHHDGIVEVFDCDMHGNGRAYIVMEMLHGESLAARLGRQRALGGDWRSALAIGGALADAVGAAHAKNIVHRDLKPDNVFLVTDEARPHGWRVKVLDFGIAKLMGREGDTDRPASRTRTGTLMGTPIYMSPEQCRGARRVDHRTDVYSLGCILYEVLEGRPPFVYEGYGELISAHMNEAPPPLTEQRAPWAVAANQLIERMLAKSPDDRPATMAEVRAALAVVSAAGSGLARAADQGQGRHAGERPAVSPAARRQVTAVMPTPVPGERLTTPAGATTTLSSGTGEELRIPRRSNRTAIFATLAGMAAAGVAAAVLLVRAPSSVSEPPATTAPSPAPGPAAPAPAPAPAAPEPPPAPAPATISIEVSDAPAGVTVTVDGSAGRLPLTLPRSSDVHTLVFQARGFADRTLKVDATTNRMLTLAMQPAAPPKPAGAHRPAGSSGGDEGGKSKPVRPSPRAISNDARKL